MADGPRWGFGDLTPTTRWVAAYGLATTLTPPDRPLCDEDWNELCTSCGAHRLGGHLVAAVADRSLPTTDLQRQETAAIEDDLTITRIRYDEVCRPVLDALAASDIPYRLIKGSALGWSDYPDPQLRPTADLDLLVPGFVLGRAVHMLEESGGHLVNPEPTAGFARLVFKGLTVTMPSGLEVDLHRILCWGPLGVRVPEADLWAPGRKFDRLGMTETTLDVERTLIHMCAHLLILGSVRASEVRDVAQLATSSALDPERAVATAKRWGHEAVLAVALVMAEHELSLEAGTHPLSRWAAEYRVGLRDRIWLRVDRPDAPVAGVEPAAVLFELTGLRSRATLIRAVVAPRPDTDPTLGHRLSSLVGARGRRGRH